LGGNKDSLAPTARMVIAMMTMNNVFMILSSVLELWLLSRWLRLIRDVPSVTVCIVDFVSFVS
jgi:hypothetical protein